MDYDYLRRLSGTLELSPSAKPPRWCGVALSEYSGVEGLWSTSDST
jgi:hypothetical protein